MTSETRCATSTIVFVVLLVTLALGGCSNPKGTRIDIRDNSVALPELRVAYNFDHNKQAASPHAGYAIELDVTKTNGSASQSLASGQLPIILDRTTFTAPQQILNDFDLTYRELSWRYRGFNFNEGKLGLELSAGIGMSLLELKVSSATQVATKKMEGYGARAGLGLIYNLSPGSSFQAKISGYYAPLVPGVHDIERFDLVYAKAFLDNFRLRAGYTFWRLYGSNNLESEFKLEFSGPVLALDLEF